VDIRRWLPIAGLYLLASCGTASDAPVPGIPFADLFDTVRAGAAAYPYKDGEWDQDFGDAAFYGPAFYVTAGLRDGNASDKGIGAASEERNLAVLRKANEDTTYFLGAIDEVLMAALGVIEAEAATGAGKGLAELDGLLDRLNPLIEGFGTYLDMDMDSYSMQTYGPTTVTAVIALLNLRYADLLKPPRAAEWKAFGLAVIDATDAKAWNGTVYKVKPASDLLEIYPNVSMILANAEAFRLTGDEKYRKRCLDVYQGMQALKDPVKKCYHSPYSAVYMGAKTDDYSTLSSQNYTIMALALLYELTGDAKYRDEITAIAAFLEKYLLVDGRLLHHWMDGRVAIPTDPEYFCTGCNLQFLFVSLYADTHVFRAEAR
jgi:hypothetical protein